MAKTTPTQRTIAELNHRGIKSGVVEKFVRGNGIAFRKDLFGIIDIIALDFGRGVIGIQCCAGGDFTAHYRKLTEDKVQDSLDWLKTPGAILELWGWRQLKAKPGGKAMIWQPRIQEITIFDLLGQKAN